MVALKAPSSPRQANGPEGRKLKAVLALPLGQIPAARPYEGAARFTAAGRPPS